MKLFTSTLLASVLLAAINDSPSVDAWAFQARPTKSKPSPSATRVGYVPDGLTAAQYQKLKLAEQSHKNLGAVGPRGFKSRSLKAFQEAMDKGEANHLMPVFNYKEKVKRGEIRNEDVPYMVRGGSWDNSDVQGARKKRWSATDREYARGGYKKEQSVSILGSGPGFDWTGTQGKEKKSKSMPGLS